MVFSPFSLAKKKHIKIEMACEIGVHSLKYSLLKEFIYNEIECHLFEAMPDFCRDIKKSIAPYKNTHLFPFAVGKFDGTVDLCVAGPSTFQLHQETSPALVNDGLDKGKCEKVNVVVKDFYDLDRGCYDLVCIDVEGGEFPILSRMRSRPKMLFIETHGRNYRNPFLLEILDWTKRNGYIFFGADKSDSIFLREDAIRSTFFDIFKANLYRLRYLGLPRR